MLSHRSVDVAARMALVEYNTENIDSPILTVKDAVEKSSFWVSYLHSSFKLLLTLKSWSEFSSLYEVHSV